MTARLTWLRPQRMLRALRHCEILCLSSCSALVTRDVSAGSTAPRAPGESEGAMILKAKVLQSFNGSIKQQAENAKDGKQL